MEELKLEPKELKEVLKKRGISAELAAWCMFCGATKGAEAMPTQFRQVGFEQVKELVASGVMSELISQIPEKAQLASWCMFCGATKTLTPGELVVQEKLTDEKIEELAKDILRLVKSE